ncbi:MAG: histidine kinase [Saprospiraceae bacterium]|jgi:signal transduction histidine kinase/ligand-binding sensor domain-containing protein|nr:histidine kinase [Saprospiraceae bacterium]
MRTILLALFVSIHIWAIGQHDFPGFATYNTENMGFRAKGVVSVYHDPLGYLWFCGYGGLERWDGNNIKHYPYDRLNPRAMPESLHASIIMDKTGKYWINSHSCLSILDPKLPIDSAVTRVYRASNNPDVPILHSLTGSRILSDEKGNFWMAWPSQGGLLYIVPDKMQFDFKKIPCEDGSENMLISATQPDSVGQRVWLFSTKHGFCSMNTTDFKVVHYEADLKKELMRLWHVKADMFGQTGFFWSKHGYVWCISDGQPLARFFVDTRKAELYDCENLIFRGGGLNYLEDSRGNFWIASENIGVYFLDMAARKCTVFKPDDKDPASLAGDLMNYVNEDRQGNIWLSHNIAGCSKFNYKIRHPKRTFPLGQPSLNVRGLQEITDIATDLAGNEYLQSPNGFFIKPNGQDDFQKIGEFTASDRYFSDGEGNRYVIIPEGYKKRTMYYDLPHPFLEPIDAPAFVPAGIYKFSAKALHYDKLPTNPSKEAYEAFKSMSAWAYDKSGGEQVLWISCPKKGLMRYFFDRGNLELVSNDTIVYNDALSSSVEQIQLDCKNNLWFRLSWGLARYSPATRSWKKWLYHPGDVDFMSVPPYYKMLVDSKDRVWLASLVGGAVWFDGEEFHNVSRNIPGLYDRCYTIAEQRNGEIWFATKESTVRYDPETGRYKIYDLLDNSHLIAFKDDSTAILGGYGPLVYVPIEGFDLKKPVPKTVISELKIFENDRSELLYLPEITLPHDQNYLTFTFGSLDFVSLDKGRFAWKLEGADQDWVEPTDNRSFASYSTLPPGDYTFRVKSCNADGIWDEKGASVKVTILPPWWKTWWFRSMYILAAAALTWWLIHQNTLRKLAAQRAEIQQQQALDRERERIARDMHDDLGSGLSAIHLLSNIAKQKADPAIQSEIEKIATSSAHLNQNIREIIWTVNAADDSLASLSNFLRRYCADFQESTGLKVDFEAPEMLPEIMLNGELRRSLFLCVKEAMNNAAKHAGASKIVVKLDAGKSKIALTVSDNGSGFDVAGAFSNGGNGLKNLKHRMEAAGGNATVESKYGETKLRFEIEI